MSTPFLVEDWDTNALIAYLQRQNLRIDQHDFNILRMRKIDGQVFLDMTEEKFMQDGLERGPAMKLAKEAKTLKDNMNSKTVGVTKEKWTGYYASYNCYNSQPLVVNDESSMDIELTFSPSNPDKIYKLNRIDKEPVLVSINDKVVKEFSGSGKDEVGDFEINHGVVTKNGNVYFVKTYRNRHSWIYDGKLLPVGICGMWGTSSACGGNFLIWKK